MQMAVTEEEKAAIERVLSGTWIMKAMSTTFPGEVTVDHPEAHGHLSYNTDLGTVRAEIFREDPNQPTGILHFQYCGGFEITGKDEIKHHLDWFANSGGTNTIQDKTLTRQFNYNAQTGVLTIIGPSNEYDDAQIVIEWVKGLDGRNQIITPDVEPG